MQKCNTRTISSEKHFFMKSPNFILVRLESYEGLLQVLDIRAFRGPSGDVPRASCASWVFPYYIYDNLLECNVYHLKIVANHGSFIPLKYSLAGLITQHFQENNPLFYDL